mgnify:CR=1 FL=1
MYVENGQTDDKLKVYIHPIKGKINERENKYKNTADF